MTISERTRPYEFLVRWGEDSTIRGAHVQNIVELVRDGEIIHAKTGEALHVSLAGEAGVPLADVLQQLHADALLTSETLRTERDQMAVKLREAEHARDGALSRLESTEKQRDTAIGELRRLKQALAAAAAAAKTKE